MRTKSNCGHCQRLLEDQKMDIIPPLCGHEWDADPAQLGLCIEDHVQAAVLLGKPNFVPSSAIPLA